MRQPQGHEGRRRDITVRDHDMVCGAMRCLATRASAVPLRSGEALLWPSDAGRRWGWGVEVGVEVGGWQLAVDTWAGRVDDRMPMQARLHLRGAF